MEATQIDSIYVHERIVLISIYSILFIIFAFQNYIRFYRTKPKKPFFQHRNVKCIAHLSGLMASFWAIMAWIDVHHVFRAVPAVLNEFAFAAAFSSLITKYVLHVAVAVRAVTVTGFCKQSKLYDATGGVEVLRWVWEKYVTGRSDVMMWTSALLPWASSIIMAILMTSLDRAWPNLVFLLTAALVVMVSVIRLLIVRRRVAAELRQLNPSGRMYSQGIKSMRRWRTFTRLSVALVTLVVCNALLFCYVFLVEDYDSPVVFLDPTSYTFGGGGFATVAGVVLAALLVATLWYSWMWSGQQIESSGTADSSGNKNSVSMSSLRKKSHTSIPRGSHSKGTDLSSLSGRRISNTEGSVSVRKPSRPLRVRVDSVILNGAPRVSLTPKMMPQGPIQTIQMTRRLSLSGSMQMLPEAS